MKKLIKMLILVFSIVLISIFLTGCGKDKQTEVDGKENVQSSSKNEITTMVATKTEEDETMGSYTQEIKINFKDNKISDLEMAMEFEKEEVAQLMYGLLGGASEEDEEIITDKIRLEGKKIIMEMDAKEFAETEEGIEEDMSTEAIKQSFEEDGYKVTVK